jgi:hypothetical protein
MLSSIRNAIRFSSYFADDSCFSGYMNDLVTVDVHNPIGVVFVRLFVRLSYYNEG